MSVRCSARMRWCYKMKFHCLKGLQLIGNIAMIMVGKTKFNIQQFVCNRLQRKNTIQKLSFWYSRRNDDR